MLTNPYYATLDRDGTEDEITIFTPNGRPMLRVAFWDEPDIASAEQLKTDALLIVSALNAYRPRKPRKKPSDDEKRAAKIAASIRANLRKPMPKLTVYKATA